MPVEITLQVDKPGPELAERFSGLSYESSALLPRSNGYYFTPANAALVELFRTLGIGSLRVGANAVDDSAVPIPQEAEIDLLFAFAKAANTKVNYSFRLKNGDPLVSARLAKYIDDHYRDLLDCYSIGNEPMFYVKPYEAWLAIWKPHYEAILKAVPGAKFCAPSIAGPGSHEYVLRAVDDLWPLGHMAMFSNHHYFFGNARIAERNPEEARARLLSNSALKLYECDYNILGAQLAAKNVPYRLDELNSCFNGGAKNVSDTYAAALWALDCTHWWAARNILGMNYHTGDSVGLNEVEYAAANYSSFVSLPDGGFDVRPMAYGLLAFKNSSGGRTIPVKVNAPPNLDVTAYGYLDSETVLLTVINKSHGIGALDISFDLPRVLAGGTWERMNLLQKENDTASKTGIELGGAPIDPQGKWAGKWAQLPEGNITIRAGTAALLKHSK